MKRLLFLGAGVFQFDGIRAAREAGCHVISVDNIPGNVGHRVASESLGISTTSVSELATAASRLAIDGVFSMASDVALPALARVSEHLGLPGPRSELVATLVNKEKFRRFQTRAGLAHPRFASGSSFSEILGKLGENDSALVLKPAASSGSRGITLLRDIHSAQAEEAFGNAARSSRSGVVMAEAYVEGKDVTAEGILHRGRLLHLGLTRRHTDGFSVHGHEAPADMSERQKSDVVKVLMRHFSALGYDEGPFDADLRVSDHSTQVIELTPRLGGNGVPWVVEAATGFPLVREAVRMALGEEPAGSLKAAGGSFYSILLTSSRSGRFQSCNDEQRMREVFPELLQARIVIPRDRRIHAFRHGGHVLGFALVRKKSGLDFASARARLCDAFALRLEEEVERDREE